MDARREAPAVGRNREPILGVLRGVLPQEGAVLEVASGTGEHAIFFAQHFLELSWQPTDPDPDARASIDAWRRATGAPNVLPALALDVREEEWPRDAADAVVCINMIHIAPWEAALGLLRGASKLLAKGAPLFLYGPYKRHGKHTAESNQRFDESLRARDATWGVRDLEGELVPAAAEAGFQLERVEPMPANNFSVVFSRT